MQSRRLVTVSVALVIAVMALAASAWTFDLFQSKTPAVDVRSWPALASTWRGHCDKVASPRGSDRNAGRRAAPYRTAERLVHALAPGQTGCLRGGRYHRAEGSPVVLSIRRSGRPGAPIVLRSYPGERARIAGITEIERDASWIRLADLDFEGDGSQNTIKIYGADIAIESSDITNRQRGQSCLILGSPDKGVAVRPLIRGNRLHDCGSPANGNKDHAIYASNTVGGRIVRNLIVNSAAYAIQFYPDAHGTLFERNVVDGDGDSIRGGVLLGGDGRQASSDNLVAHNVIAFAATYGVSSNWEGPEGTGNVVRDNCIWQARHGSIQGQAAGFSAAGNVVADPKFRNRRRGDYRLSATSGCARVLR